MNLEVNRLKQDEIVFPNDSTMIMSRINAQMADFNPQGTLVAIGCKYANILIMDFMTKEIVRCLSLYEDEYNDLAVNSDVDQFSHFRKLNYTYFEDDFVLIQQHSKQQRTEPVSSDHKKVILFEPKEKAKCKAQVCSIEWSSDGRFIVVCFKVEPQIAVWDV
jgi:WD40 repeat protein